MSSAAGSHSTAEGWWYAPGVVLALREVDAGLAAVGGVDLRHQRGRHLNVAHPALVDGRAEAGQVAHDTAAGRHDQVAPLRTALGERAQHELDPVDRLVLLACHDHDSLVALDALQPRDVLVGDDEAPAAQRREEPGGDQPAPDEDRVGPRLRRSPDQARPGRRLGQRPDERQRAAQGVAIARRHDRVGHGLVERRAGRARAPRSAPGRAPAAAPSRTRAARRPRARSPGARPCGGSGRRAPAPTARPRRRARSPARRSRPSSSQTTSSSRSRNAASPSRSKNDSIGSPMRCSSSRSESTACAAELRRQRAGAGRLARAHEPDQDDRAAGGYVRLHPMRSR